MNTDSGITSGKCSAVASLSVAAASSSSTKRSHEDMLFETT